MLKPSAGHSSRTLSQLHVTAQFYLENKREIHPRGVRAYPTQKMRREERQRDRESTCTWERDPQPFGSSIYVFPPPGPALCKLG